MKQYVWAARTLIVVGGALFITRGILPSSGGFGFFGQADSSSEILYHEQSPFQALNELPSHSPVTEPHQAPLEEVKTFDYKVPKGATFVSVWKGIGGDADELSRALDELKGSGFTPQSLRVGEELQVTHKNGQLIEVKKKLASGSTAALFRNNVGELEAHVEHLKIVTREKRVTGTIFSSLVDSASGASLPYSLVDDFVDLFSDRVEFRKDLQPGDSFTVIFEDRVTADGEQLEPGVIKAASLSLSGRLFAVVRDVDKSGKARYFDEKGQMPSKAFLRYPVKFTRISSVFTHARFHPVLKVSRPHNGVDFAAPIGTPIRTVGDGTIIFSGYSASGGNMIRIAHDSRYTTEYMHLNSISKNARKGARVSRGDLIGTLGNTGLSSGPHLHYALFDKGKYVDPMKAKVVQSDGPVRPPAAVIAMIAELKKAHEAITVAAKSSNKKA
jgi:murein DD-endopeptidase MepM/ murein hydrolase activator NlpD